jgi:hypothetical protein
LVVVKRVPRLVSPEADGWVILVLAAVRVEVVEVLPVMMEDARVELLTAGMAATLVLPDSAVGAVLLLRAAVVREGSRIPIAANTWSGLVPEVRVRERLRAEAVVLDVVAVAVVCVKREAVRVRVAAKVDVVVAEELVRLVVGLWVELELVLEISLGPVWRRDEIRL